LLLLLFLTLSLSRTLTLLAVELAVPFFSLSDAGGVASPLVGTVEGLEAVDAGVARKVTAAVVVVQQLGLLHSLLASFSTHTKSQKEEERRGEEERMTDPSQVNETILLLSSLSSFVSFWCVCVFFSFLLVL
jgi:hypothetical protein